MNAYEIQVKIFDSSIVYVKPEPEVEEEIPEIV